MTIENLCEIVEEAISISIDYIQKNPISILSEGDFERVLSCNIACLLKNRANSESCSYMVYNQVTHYNDPLIDNTYRVDIVIMDSARIKPNDKHHKGYIYDDSNSVAIELKYFRVGDCVDKIKDDLQKSNALIQDGGIPTSCLYVIALTEVHEEKQEDAIKELYDSYKDKKHLKMYLCCKIK